MKGGRRRRRRGKTGVDGSSRGWTRGKREGGKYKKKRRGRNGRREGGKQCFIENGWTNSV